MLILSHFTYTAVGQDNKNPTGDNLFSTLNNCLVLFAIKPSDPVKHLRVLTHMW